MIRRPLRLLILGFALVVMLGAMPALAQTADFDRDRCTFTTTGNNPYFPLWPGYTLEYEGQELDDEDELVDIAATITILPETEMVDGVLTRVLEERESEDDELVEVSRNFVAICRETGDLWYFGEDVDDYDDGVIVGHEGEWRAGINGAKPGILMPGTPMLGAFFFQEIAPGVAEDFGEVVSFDASLDLPAGSFDNLLKIEEGSGLDPEDFSEKWYSHGLGLVKDDALDLVEVTLPPCQPDDTTHCLSNGRFEVEAEWSDGTLSGDANAILPSADSGEFWFFNPGNTELLVKVLDACDAFGGFWVFAAGLTDVEVTLTVTDTQTNEERVYTNPLGGAFQPVLDTAAFATCP